MKNPRNLGFIISFLHYAALAVAQTHIPEPAVNLGDTSFLDGVAGPGIVVEEIGDGTHSSGIVDANGHQVPGIGQVNTIGSLTHIAWLTRHRLVGGWYGTEVVLTTAHVTAGRDLTAGGLGDMTISPLILQWNEKKLGTVAFDQRVVFDFDLPVGEYSQNANLNLSSHVYTVHPYYAVTAFLLKRLETSWRVHYLWSSEIMNHRNRSTQINASRTSHSLQRHTLMWISKAPLGRWQRIFPETDHRSKDQRDCAQDFSGKGWSDWARRCLEPWQLVPLREWISRTRRRKSSDRKQTRTQGREGIREGRMSGRERATLRIINSIHVRLLMH